MTGSIVLIHCLFTPSSKDQEVSRQGKLDVHSNVRNQSNQWCMGVFTPSWTRICFSCNEKKNQQNGADDGWSGSDLEKVCSTNQTKTVSFSGAVSSTILF